MNILLISRCEKNALQETRRILDQFAERKGDRTWQTAITMEGLKTLRRLLRKSARRNTAVACHWLRGTDHSELLWIVGNQRHFSTTGTVPTNTTRRNILRAADENPWRNAEAVALMAAIAALFHDFGKATKLFQQTLAGQTKHRFQPYRHEWVSLLLFRAFVRDSADSEWLTRLAEVSRQDEVALLASFADNFHCSADDSKNPLNTLSGLAQVIGWLIVSHHRLPQWQGATEASLEPQLGKAFNWLNDEFNQNWNAIHHQKKDFFQQNISALTTFPQGTPLCSTTWCARAQQVAQRARQASTLQDFAQLLDQPLSVHLARLSLMLADHVYSAGPAAPKWHDVTFSVWANTDRQTKKGKQPLDDHIIGVARSALSLGRSLPWLRGSLPALGHHRVLRQRAGEQRFRWQDRAFECAAALRQPSQQQGFFGINMASTGCGKTFANARIMYALADESLGCRFSVALGLRSLTLQTGDALRERLKLDEETLAVLIGSDAVRQLHHLNRANNEPDDNSESADNLFAEHQYIQYDGTLEQGSLQRWLQRDRRLQQLVSAPVLVSTIDHLIPATEGIRGGRQIAPMLRLLSADLVLDEPDDFDLDDQYALCRLVNWAGMLGSRVLLSSATLPPNLLATLFRAYQNGYRHWHAACGEAAAELKICCAWFDEWHSSGQQVANGKEFDQWHNQFVGLRVEQLRQEKPLRWGQLVDVELDSKTVIRPCTVVEAVAKRLLLSMAELHRNHCHNPCRADGKTVSLGLIRMANINPLVAVARQLLQSEPPEGHRIHYCVYHSQHPLAMRSHIERRLDSALQRHHPEELWQVAEINAALEQYPEQHHLFVVIASPVAEVGRDWDLDWAIAEPSSLRSLIQLAGRIQRHRRQQPSQPNLHILSRNIRSLRGKKIAYCKPGFESELYRLDPHDLHTILREEEYLKIDACYRIQSSGKAMRPRQKGQTFSSLVEMEHWRTWDGLQGCKKSPSLHAVDWWQKKLHWNGELQRRTRFRKSRPQQCYWLQVDEQTAELTFWLWDIDGDTAKQSGDFADRSKPVALAEGVSYWMTTDYLQIYAVLADELSMSMEQVSQRFGEINLDAPTNNTTEVWQFEPLLGVYRILD